MLYFLYWVDIFDQVLLKSMSVFDLYTSEPASGVSQIM